MQNIKGPLDIKGNNSFNADWGSSILSPISISYRKANEAG